MIGLLGGCGNKPSEDIHYNKVIPDSLKTVAVEKVKEILETIKVNSRVDDEDMEYWIGEAKQTVIELGFEKEPDGMYYERGWMNFTVNIHFGERKITKKTFWEHVLRTVEVRGEINFKNRLKELLK